MADASIDRFTPRSCLDLLCLMRTNIKRLAARKYGAERVPRKVIKNAIISFQQNNSLYARSPDPLSCSDKSPRDLGHVTYEGH